MHYLEDMMSPEYDADFDETMDFELFNIAHEAGYPEGSWLPAWRYKLGEGTSQSDVMANSLFEIAAKRDRI